MLIQYYKINHGKVQKLFYDLAYYAYNELIMVLPARGEPGNGKRDLRVAVGGHRTVPMRGQL